MQLEEAAAGTWKSDSDEPQPTSYEVLQVHPAAPLELITAAYWRLAGDAQSRRSLDNAAEADLHALTRAYQMLTNAETRAEYDSSIGVAEQNLAPQVPHSRGKGWFGRKRDAASETRVDYYEILRITPTADAPVVEEAYSTLRTYYVRLVQSGYSPIELLDYLEDAYAVAADPDKRKKYDAERERSATSAVAPAAVVTATVLEPKPKAPPKPKPAPVARPKVTAVRVASLSRATSRPAGGSPFGAITGAFGAMSRQLSTMTKREQEQADDRLTEREHDHVDTSEVEATLLQRISSSVDSPDAAPAHESSRSIARLAVIDGPESGTIFEIQHFPLTLGGDGDCDITLPGLASQHARLLFRDGRFVVYNLAPPESGAEGDSEPWWIVESGDDLSLGPYRLRFTVTAD
jgi:curved DNA-binding protein CbpA